jgi:hypothetical protein
MDKSRADIGAAPCDVPVPPRSKGSVTAGRSGLLSLSSTAAERCAVGELDSGNHSILGFGGMMNYVSAFEQTARDEGFQIATNRLFAMKLLVEEFISRGATWPNWMMRWKRLKARQNSFRVTALPFDFRR